MNRVTGNKTYAVMGLLAMVISALANLLGGDNLDAIRIALYGIGWFAYAIYRELDDRRG